MNIGVASPCQPRLYRPGLYPPYSTFSKQRNSSSLSHPGTAPRLRSSLLLSSQPSPAPLNPSRDAGAGGTQGLRGSEHEFEERHKAFLLCFCFVTHKDDSMCFYAHRAIQNSPRPCCEWPAQYVILFVDLGLLPLPRLSLDIYLN